GLWKMNIRRRSALKVSCRAGKGSKTAPVPSPGIPVPTFLLRPVNPYKTLLLQPMFLQVLKSKIHRAVVTEANLNYMGSITIDEDLMDAADLVDGERVQVVNNNNGARLETYVITGERG